MFKVRVVTEDKYVKDKLPKEIYTVYGVYKEERTKYTFFTILTETDLNRIIIADLHL
ncbi:MAG: hypothetical protein IJB90_05585 [Clostridia bacterium]|nr:hypothetical protein [Clostridia bacterium]